VVDSNQWAASLERHLLTTASILEAGFYLVIDFYNSSLLLLQPRNNLHTANSGSLNALIVFSIVTMRLIHTCLFSQSIFFGGPVPQYVILSHTWGGEEVTFQDYSALELYNEDDLRGYLKIRHLCEQACRDGYDWAWIDTACIDKTSSAELSEAINSMMSWYRNAAICYVYLDDVTDISNFGRSRWFTRGWTLQELLAPQFVNFYGRDWKLLGTKSNLATEIFMVTKIHKVVLETPDVMDQFSIATRMSWAARREKT
jgi:hypothetical protein